MGCCLFQGYCSLQSASCWVSGCAMAQGSCRVSMHTGVEGLRGHWGSWGGQGRAGPGVLAENPSYRRKVSAGDMKTCELRLQCSTGLHLQNTKSGSLKCSSQNFLLRCHLLREKFWLIYLRCFFLWHQMCGVFSHTKNQFSNSLKPTGVCPTIQFWHKLSRVSPES